jgi:oligopeptide transport system substrate-binding protein
MGNTIEGLYEMDDKGIPQLAMAESVEISKDGRTHKYRIRDAKWSNGVPVTAKDFVYGWQRLADPAVGGEYGYMIDIAGIKNAADVANGKLPPSALGLSAPDDKTFVVELETPLPYFAAAVSFTCFAPVNEEFAVSQGDLFARTPDNLIYNGAYKIDAENFDITGTNISLIKNESYYNAANVDIDRIYFQVIADSQQGVMSYENGEIDYVTLTGDLVDRYSDHQDYENILGNFNWYLYFNSEKIANKKLRQAIAYAINREDIVKNVLKNGSLVATSIVMRGLHLNQDGLDFVDACGIRHSYDPEKAKALWAEAQKETDIRSFSLIYEEDTEFVSPVAAYIQNNIETVLEGFKVELQRMPKKARVDLMDKGEYEVALHRWGPDYADASSMLLLYVSDSQLNRCRLKDKDVDKNVADAASSLALNPRARWDAMVKAEAGIIDSALSIPIFQTGEATLQRDKVKNLLSRFTGPRYLFKYVRIEEVR